MVIIVGMWFSMVVMCWLKFVSCFSGFCLLVRCLFSLVFFFVWVLVVRFRLFRFRFRCVIRFVIGLNVGCVLYLYM